MFFTKKVVNFDLDNLIKTSLRKKKIFSGYRKIFFFTKTLSLNLKIKALRYRKYSNAGRNCRGSVVVYTKAALKSKRVNPSLNYNFRQRELGFISSFFNLPYTHKFVLLFNNSNGSYSYINATSNLKLFLVTRLKSVTDLRSKKTLLESYLSFISSKSVITPLFFLIKHLPKNKPVSMLELYPNKSVQYIRSPGSKGKILKMDTRTNTSVIALPSGVKKVFSIYSLGSAGQILHSGGTKSYTNNKAGYYNINGKKPIVRGVARNPVDHPHGGRTKAIRYPRTP